MIIDKSALKVGFWYTDEDDNYIPYDENSCTAPDGAVYAHTMYPLELREDIYRLDKNGRYGEKNRVVSFRTHIGRGNDKLIMAMANSGDYDLYDAIGVYACSCERCTNVLWNKYLPEDNEGYPEFSEEWYKANTTCDFCHGLDKRDGIDDTNVG